MDNISVELLRSIHKHCPDIMLTLLNTCLQLGFFPTPWKDAKLVLIGKPDRDLTIAKNYRPICLLSVISKLLDKLVTQRLTHFFKTNGLLHDRQHGFRAGRSCETANHSLWVEVHSAMQNKNQVCLISLDVEGAFDNVWRQSVLYKLTSARCPFNLFSLIRDYFCDRSVTYCLNDEKWTFPAERGVPQGSCSGPFFWNVVLDTIFEVQLPVGCTLQAFADDIVLIVQGPTKADLENRGILAISRLIQWAAFHKLTFSLSKSVLMPITFGGRLSMLDPPCVRLQGQLLPVQKSFRYLGVWWDGGLTFTDHFNRVRRRVDLLSYRLSVVADRFYSKHTLLYLHIYRAAIEPFLLYGYGAWGHRLNLKKIKDTLNSLQQRPLLKLTRAYRTVSTVALPVLAGVLPLDLKALVVFKKFQVLTLQEEVRVDSVTFRPQDYKTRVDLTNIHPLNRWSFTYTCNLPTGDNIEIFTDGSKMDGVVGSSMVVFYHGALIDSTEHRLSDFASVFQAEIHGMDLALNFILTLQSWDTVRIFSDSLSLLKALSMDGSLDPEIWCIKEKLHTILRRRHLSLHWVPAHQGIMGNEMADWHAKNATKHPQVDWSVQKPRRLLIRELQTEILITWQERWVLAEKGRQTADFFPQVE
ncbi:Putative protein in type-1 retrotransposable element R1DM [Araneus ventricosus]|uniref:Retrovirus-related Pol polyprotein from type-1 retrotransposable element R1 n=1 Tax=Araneus ventricosus TaxID=182803 RepID=A0A4Y2BYR2_ARAVE|nr:Putative protein in type-1 retrotransposable element R1DM [Araneus ventricosus]